jgi:hypothetical protein
MKLFTAIPLALIVVTSSIHAQIIFSENFDGQTTGSTVSGFTAVTATTARPTGRGAVIVDDTLPNRSLNLYDYDTVNNARVEEDFAARSSVHLSMNFQRNADIAVDPSAASTTAFYVTIGLNGQSQGTQANRAIEFRLFSNGIYRMNRGVQDASGNFVSSSLTSSTASFEPSGTTFNRHSLDLFVYSGLPGGATLSYTGPDSALRVLDPNSFAVFIDNTFITPASSPTANGDFGIFNSAFYNVSDNLGRLGLVTGGAASQSGFDYLVDNVVLSAIPVPEPSSLAFLSLGLVTLISLRRKAKA